MEAKPFQTFYGQIETLRKKGLIINDEHYAYKVLSHNNYYRLSGYTLTLRKKDKFLNNVTLEDVMQIYNFDIELRTSILNLLDYVEISFRTHFAYYHSKKYGTLGYLDKKNYKDGFFYAKFLNNICNLIEPDRDKYKEPFVSHHNKKHNGFFPCWAIVELMSFGDLSKCFKNLHDDLKKEICNNHYSKIPYRYIDNWLQALNILRNICAHRGRLYNRYITYSPNLSTQDKKMLKSHGLDLNKSNKQTFTFIFIIFKLLDDEVIKDKFITDLENLAEKYPFVDLKQYGFPTEWVKILN